MKTRVGQFSGFFKKLLGSGFKRDFKNCPKVSKKKST